MSSSMEGEPLGNPGGFGPRFDKLVDGCRQLEHMLVRCLVPTFRHPSQRFVGKRKINRLFGLLHGHAQAVLTVIDKDILPFQAENITDTQSAETGKQVSTFYLLVLHRSGNQCPHLFDGHVRTYTLRHLGLLRFIHLVERVSQNPFGTYSGIQSTVEDLVMVLRVEATIGFPLGR